MRTKSKLVFACLTIVVLRLKKKVDQLPVKSKKLKVRNRYFNYLVVSDENENTLIQKRTAKGIWQNLYEFPLIETAKEEEFDFVAEQIKTDYFSTTSPQCNGMQ
jgi:A/G-specific adenine glycosylase